jgi:rRNA maturation RNase YbeY
VISIDTAAAQARASRVALAARLETLLVHGVLHLVGYDHERSPAEERRMRRKERAVRAALPAAPAGRRPGATAASR